MAEVFGVVAGAIGFIPILLQLKTGIDTLREMRDAKDKIPAEVARLAADLELLLFFLEPLLTRSEVGEGILRICLDRCARVAEDLEVIKAKLSEAAHRKGLSVRRVTAYQGLKHDVKSLHESITAAHAIVLGVSQTISVTSTQIHPAHEPLPVKASNGSGIDHIPGTAFELTERSSTTTKQPLYSGSLAVVRSTPRRSCYDGSDLRCACSCHQAVQVTQGFLTVNYTPVRMLSRPCSKRFCQNRHVGASAKLTLVDLGLWWSITIQAFVVQEAGGFAFRPGLVVNKTVPSDSSGFSILNDLLLGIDAENVAQIQNRLLKLSRDDPSLRHQVNPDGLSLTGALLDRLYEYNALVRSDISLDPKFAIDMFTFLMSKLHIPMNFQHPRFTIMMARFSIYNGYYPIDEFMRLGFDPGDYAAPEENDASLMFFYNARGPDTTRDPFLVKFLQTMCQHDYDLDWMSPLHRAVLSGSAAEFDRSLKTSDLNQRNAMGQTPLHLSVLNGKYVSCLISAGHDVDATDQWEKRPLEYALAYGKKDVAMVLLEAGADWSLNARQPSTIECAMKTIMVSKDASILFDIASKIRSMTDVKTSQRWARLVTIECFRVGSSALNMHNWPWMGESTTEYTMLVGFLSMCGNPNFNESGDTVGPNHKGSTLLHLVTTVAQVQGLVEHGFYLVNNVNLAGETALSSAIWCIDGFLLRDGEFFSALLEAGADVNFRNERGRSAIFRAVFQFERSCYLPSGSLVLDVLHILLDAGADYEGRDYCLCSCSTGGCQPVSAFNSFLRRHGREGSWMLMHGDLAKLEWLALVEKHRGHAAARATLVSVIRELKHEELGMTHVCCTMIKGALDRDTALEILEEESEFIEMLDREMSELENLDFQALLQIWFGLLRVVYAREPSDSSRQERLDEFVEPMVQYKFFMAYLHCHERNTSGGASSQSQPSDLRAEASGGQPLESVRQLERYTTKLSRLISLSEVFGFDVGDMAKETVKAMNDPLLGFPRFLREMRDGDKAEADEYRRCVLDWDVAGHQRDTD